LSPVFNIRGATNLDIYNNYHSEEIYDKYQEKINNAKTEEEKQQLREEYDNLPYAFFDINTSVKYSEEDYMITDKKTENENAKGIIQLSDYSNAEKIFPILGIQIHTSGEVIKELKKYCKGFFFVRQKRMPLTLAQGIVVGLDKESRTPTLPTLGGVINDINYESSFIKTEDINDINFVSEGFLNRYYYTLEEKPTEVWKRIGKIVAIAVAAVVAVAACVFTCGAAAAAIAGISLAMALTTTMTVGGALVLSSVIIGSAVGGTILVTGITGEAINAGIKRIRQVRNKDEALAYDGRNEEVPDGYERKDKDESRKITHDLNERYIIKDPTYNTPDAIIVPDYQVNGPYYN
jgi:hypothetical protein